MFSLGDEGLESRLRVLREDVLRFNQSIPLISRRDPEAVVDRLLAESLAASQALSLEDGQALLDLGSGAGFPGLVLALVQPGLRVSLLERRAGHCSFLQREVRALGLANARVLEGTSQTWARIPREQTAYDWVTLKAVAPPEEALRLARPFLAPGGKAILFRAAAWDPAGSVEPPWRLDGRLGLDVPLAPEPQALFVLGLGDGS